MIKKEAQTSLQNEGFHQERKKIVGQIIGKRLDTLGQLNIRTKNSSEFVIGAIQEAVSIWDIDMDFFLSTNERIKTDILIALGDEYVSLTKKQEKRQGVIDFFKVLVSEQSSVLNGLSEQPVNNNIITLVKSGQKVNSRRSAYEFTDTSESVVGQLNQEQEKFEKEHIDREKTDKLRKMIALDNPDSFLHPLHKRLGIVPNEKKVFSVQVMDTNAKKMQEKFMAIAWCRGSRLYLPNDWEKYGISLIEHEYIHYLQESFSFGIYHLIAYAAPEAWTEYQTSNAQSYPEPRAVLEKILNDHPEFEILLKDYSQNPYSENTNISKRDQIFGFILKQYGFAGLHAFVRMEPYKMKSDTEEEQIELQRFYRQEELFIPYEEALQAIENSNKIKKQVQDVNIFGNEDTYIQNDIAILSLKQLQATKSFEKEYLEKKIKELEVPLSLAAIKKIDSEEIDILKKVLQVYKESGDYTDELNDQILAKIITFCANLPLEDMVKAAKTYVDYFDSVNMYVVHGYGAYETNLYTKLGIFRNSTYKKIQNFENFKQTVRDYALEKHPDSYSIAYSGIEDIVEKYRNQKKDRSTGQAFMEAWQITNQALILSLSNQNNSENMLIYLEDIWRREILQWLSMDEKKLVVQDIIALMDVIQPLDILSEERKERFTKRINELKEKIEKERI